MATFPQRLRELRNARGLTQRQLADALKLSHGAIGLYETGQREPDLEMLRRIAGYFNVDVGDLVSDGPTSSKDPTDYTPVPTSTASHHKALPLIRTSKGARDMSVVDLETIPLLGRIVAGIPLLSEQNVVGYVEVPAQIRRKADFALEVIGDSMKGAGIQPGDIVFLRLAEKQPPTHGNIVAAMVDGEVTLKRLVKRNGTYTLVAENPAFDPIAVTDRVQVQGVYVARYTEFEGIVEPPPEELTDDELITKLAQRKGVDPDTLAGMLELLRKRK